MFFVYKSEENRKQNQTDNKLFFIKHFAVMKIPSIFAFN